MGVECTEATGESCDVAGASRERLPAVPGSFEPLATSDDFSNGPTDAELLILSLAFVFVLAANYKVKNRKIVSFALMVHTSTHNFPLRVLHRRRRRL